MTTEAVPTDTAAIEGQTELDGRRIEPDGKDPVFVRRGDRNGRSVFDVLDNEGERVLYLPPWVASVSKSQVDELVVALLRQQDEVIRRCIQIGKRQQQIAIARALGFEFVP